jgi:hypothetical protein
MTYKVNYQEMKSRGTTERTKLQQLFKQLNIKNVTYTPEGKPVAYDAFIKKNNKTIWIEVKVRQNTSDKYPDYLLEQAKYNNITKRFTSPNDQILYINFFTDNTAIIFNLTNRKIKWFTKFLPHHTTANFKKFIPKIITFLQFDENLDKKISLK